MKKFIVLFATVALICAFSMPAAAMEEKTSEEFIESLMAGVGGWKLYGSARMATWRIDTGMDEDTQWDMQGNSRLGASVSHGAVGGGFEFAVNDESGVNTRKLFGTWNTGAGQLLIGQSYVPTSSMFYSNQVYGGDEDLLSTGQLYTSRRPMIQFKTGGFKVALVEPATAGSIVVGQDAAGDDIVADVDTTLPKLEVAYSLSTDMFFVDVAAGYQSVDTEGALNESLDSLVGTVGGGFSAGPVAVKLNAMYAENGGLYGVYSAWLSLATGITPAGAIVDNEAMGYLGVVTFKANDMLTFEVGAGFREVELDTASDEVLSYYVNTTVNLAKNVFIVPEFGVIDIDSYDDETMYFGMKTQINW